MLATSTVGVLLVQSKYLLLLPFLFFAQPLVGLAAGALIKFNQLDVHVIYFLLVGTALISDLFWYWIGYYYGENFAVKFGKYFSLTHEHILQVKRLFHTYHSPILFISKLVNGIGIAIAIVFTAGLSRIKLGPYIFYNLAGEIIWSGLILALGYSLGSAYLAANSTIEKILLIVPIIVFILAFIGFTRFLIRELENRIKRK